MVEVGAPEAAQARGGDIAVSWVIPVYNELENIRPIYDRITEVHAAGPEAYRDRYEILFIDDGSSDGSFEECRRLADADPRVTVIQFRKNFGKTAGLHAGFEQVRGRRVVTIDADMQEDPGDVFRLFELLDNGHDLVSAWRKKRNDPIHKTLPSKVFNFVVANVTGLRLHDYNCGFKAYDRALVDDLSLYGDQHRFVPLLAHQRGFKVGEVPVEHKPRRFGKSKYGTRRLARGYLDFMQVLFLLTYLRRPLRLFGTIGTLFTLVGTLICLYLTIIWFMGEKIGDRPLLMLGVLLIVAGLQFIGVGLIGEMLRHASHRTGDEFTVRRVIGGRRGNRHEGT